ncbi:MAG: DegT/DnrJ/EryC1/StrS family aminotransferase, partial [Sulfuricellaceae bacterium]|nr:DegT/DnrJ/EryC1/StrS family aminotransferase [Sulfuricellaceae bacterium]
HGRHAGSLGQFGIFSFHGSKTLTTGEGGMFVTNDESLYRKVLALSNHGRVPGGKQFFPEYIGFKYKMSNLQAAIGCAQMERIEELVSRKREIFRYYAERILAMPGLTMNPEKPGTVNGYWMPTVVFDAQTGVTRESLRAAFANENIDARVFFHPLSGLPMFVAQPQNRLARDIPRRAINLPSFHDIMTEEQDQVVDVIRNVLND